jgi:hypothetical protein
MNDEAPVINGAEGMGEAIARGVDLTVSEAAEGAARPGRSVAAEGDRR